MFLEYCGKKEIHNEIKLIAGPPLGGQAASLTLL